MWARNAGIVVYAERNSRTLMTSSITAVHATMVTGLATDRVPEDDIIVPIVHFTKDNGEMSSVTLDENSQLEILPG